MLNIIAKPFLLSLRCESITLISYNTGKHTLYMQDAWGGTTPKEKYVYIRKSTNSSIMGD